VRTLLHRQIWQRFPRAQRRAALFRIASQLAPRPSSNAKAAFPFVVSGALRSSSGLGQSARLCHDALKAVGLPVFGIDLSAALMQPVDNPNFQFVDGHLLRGPATLILHVNSPLVPLAMFKIGPKFLRDKYVIGCWAWELPAVPDEWRYGVPFVHQIWAPSRFTAEALRSVAGTTPVKFLTIPVAAHGIPKPVARNADRPFTVLTMFSMASSFARKNPLAAINAFRLAFGEDPNTRLIVKTSNVAAFPAGLGLMRETIGSARNIQVLYETMDADGISALFDGSDVVISLHRSEGFGLIIAEAMLRGIPVVATDSSSSTDFVTAETGFPVPFELIPALDPQGTYNHPNMYWAEADVTAAASALRQLRSNPVLAERLGQSAAVFAANTWGSPAYVAAFSEHLGFSFSL
jgi:glycosyltransferase involved in cell wall biosynthesis